VTGYVPLTSRDLRGFDEESRKLLLWAQEQGARLRITANGHCFVYGPDGRTTTVPPNMRSGNRSAQNSRAGVRRLFK
jgi:hypothetical protein